MKNKIFGKIEKGKFIVQDLEVRFGKSWRDTKIFFNNKQILNVVALEIKLVAGHPNKITLTMIELPDPIPYIKANQETVLLKENI